MGDAATALQRDVRPASSRATLASTVGYESNRKLQKMAGNCDFDGLGAGGRWFESSRPDHFSSSGVPRGFQPASELGTRLNNPVSLGRRSRSAGRAESARPPVHGGEAESALGRGHDRVRHRGERQAIPGRDPRPVLAIHSRLGRQSGQQPAPGDPGARTGIEAPVPRCRAALPLGSGLYVRERGLPSDPRGTGHHVQHEPPRQLPRL